MLEKDKFEIMVTEEQRRKTVKCLLKVIDFQMKDIEGQAKHLEDHFKKNDRDIEEFQKFLKKEENRIVMERIEHKMNRARQELERYDDYDPQKDMDSAKELIDIADLIVENKMLIDRVDRAMGTGDYADRSTTQDEEEDEESKLSQSFIERMYKAAKKGGADKPGRKVLPASISVQFGKPIVDTHLKKNKEVLKSKSRTRMSQQSSAYEYEEQRIPSNLGRV